MLTFPFLSGTFNYCRNVQNRTRNVQLLPERLKSNPERSNLVPKRHSRFTLVDAAFAKVSNKFEPWLIARTKKPPRLDCHSLIWADFPSGLFNQARKQIYPNFRTLIFPYTVAIPFRGQKGMEIFGGKIHFSGAEFELFLFFGGQFAPQNRSENEKSNNDFG